MQGDLPITQFLQDANADDPAARERLLATIYDELYAIARQQMTSEANGRTLQPTALVNEAYM
jgi:ECF sigma factor